MNFKKLQDLLDGFVEDNYAVGNTVTVYLGGENVFNYTVGYSDLESKKLMSGNEHFYLYSCSKVTTAVAGVQLLERGKLLLSDPISKYIPEYSEMYIKTSDGTLRKAEKPITVLNLFNMTAGFDYNTQTAVFDEIRERTGGHMNTLEVIRNYAKTPLYFEPGTRFQYSLCHDILAGLVEAVTGQKFRDYVKENIFDPLGMYKTVYHETPEIVENMATQYTFMPCGVDELDIVEAQKNGTAKTGRFVEKKGNHLILGDEYDSGGAGVISTCNDYAKLMSALANFGKGLSGERILSHNGVELLRTNTLTPEQAVTFNWSQLHGYGYGLGVRTLTDKVKASSLGNIGEFGWGGAAGSSVYVDPEINLAVVYCKHNLNPSEEYYQPRVRNVVYSCLD
ncbi:MAG: beta-lactamase family protein [Clostridia bacterium]|nr:beta-lactamase family protein [Clostridia bacterium]